MQDKQKEIEMLDTELSTLLQQKRGILNEVKRLQERFGSLDSEIAAMRKKIAGESEKHGEYHNAFKRALSARREAARAIANLREQVKVKQTALKALEKRTPNIPISKVDEELKDVERMIETRRLSREEERNLVQRAKNLAGQLRSMQLVMKAKAEFEDTLQVFKELKREVDDLSSVLEKAGPGVTMTRERIKTLQNMLKQLLGEKLAIEADMMELGTTFANLTQRIEDLKSRKRELLAALKRKVEEESASLARAEMELARQKAVEKAQRGQKVSLEELKLIYHDLDEDT